MKIKHLLLLISFLIPSFASADFWYPVGTNLVPVVGTWSIKLPISGTQCLHAISGVVSGTGSDCGSGGGGLSFGQTWEFPATSNKGWVAPTSSVGIIVNASSTIGSGIDGGGLTVYGTATTTGTTTLATSGGRVGISSTSPMDLLSIGGTDGAITLGTLFGSGYNGIYLNGRSGVANYNFLSKGSDQDLYINRPSGKNIRFREANTDQIMLLSGGNLGIGSTTPDSNLSVAGTNSNIHLTGTGSAYLKIEGGSATQGRGIEFGYVGNGGQYPFSIGMNSSNKFGFWGSTNGIENGNNNDFTFDQSANMAIGTSTTLTNSRLAIYRAGSTAAGSPDLTFAASSTVSGLPLSNEFWTMGLNLADGNKFQIASSSVLGTNTRFTIDGNGNLGLGTTTPYMMMDTSGARILDITGTGIVGTTIHGGNGQEMTTISNGGAGIFTDIGGSTTGTNNFWSWRIASGNSSYSATEALRVLNTGAIGINDSSADYRLETVGSLVNGYFGVSNSTDGDILGINTTGMVGIGTTSPWAKFSVGSHNNGNQPQFVVASSSTALATSTWFMVDQFGNVGIATSVPSAQLTVQSTSTTKTTAVFQAMTGQTSPLVDFWSATASLLNIQPGGNIGLGTTTPNWTLQVASSTPYIGITDTNAPVGGKHWLLNNTDGIFSIGTSSDSLNSTTSPFQIAPQAYGADVLQVASTTGATILSQSFFDNVGVATGTPFARLSIGNRQGDTSAMFAIGSSSSAVATSTYFLVDYLGRIYANFTTSSGANQTGYWCYDTNGQFIRDTTTCLVSALKFKKNITPINAGLKEILALRPVNYYLKDPMGDTAQQFGFIADEAEKIDGRLVTHDSKGDVHAFRYEQFTAVLTKAIQDFYSQFQKLVVKVSGLENRLNSQQKEIDELKARLDKASI